GDCGRSHVIRKRGFGWLSSRLPRLYSLPFLTSIPSSVPLCRGNTIARIVQLSLNDHPPRAGRSSPCCSISEIRCPESGITLRVSAAKGKREYGTNGNNGTARNEWRGNIKKSSVRFRYFRLFRILSSDSPVRRVNFNYRDVHLADIKRFRLRAFDQIENHRHLIAAIKFVAVDAIHPGLAGH